ncbi:hypothetical protein [Streptomyces tendae]|uniref:hypothetical protein n=1 Tax=Streptomyces tendae TaxID=1932 RepID=UPI003EC061C7
MGPSLARNDSGEEHSIRSTAADVIPLRRDLAADGLAAPSGVTDSQVASWWEKVFRDMNRTLTDEQTAEAHRITSAGFGLLIDGARTAGVLTEAQAAYLSGLAVEAVRAPDFVSREQ